MARLSRGPRGALALALALALASAAALAGRAAQAAPAAAAPSSARLSFVVDQTGSNPAAFPLGDLSRWGVRQTVAGGVDCSSALAAVPGGPWFDAAGLAMVARNVAANRAAIAAARAAGVEPFLTSDLFQLPTTLFARYKAELTFPNSTCFGYRRGPSCIDIRSNFTRAVLGALFDEVVATFPGLAGVVLRYGENSPCSLHEGNAPYDTARPVESLQELLQWLRAEVVVARNLSVVFRTWDTSTALFHANASFYAAVVGAVEPHPRLVFSIKHTALDFWRRVALNPTLGVGLHPQVAEAEVGGMYAGCGSWPLYIGDGLVNGFEENAPARGLAAVFAASPRVGGVLMNHQCNELATFAPFFWQRLEEGVIARWAAAFPALSEAAAFDAYAAEELRLAGAAPRAALRAIAQGAMAANLRMYTVAAFDAAVSPAQMDRPTANWMLWNSLGGLYQLDPTAHPATCHAATLAHCQVFPYLGANGLFDAALAEKDGAAAAFARLNASAWADVAPALAPPLAAALCASTELGAGVSRVVAAGWRAMALGWQGDAAGGKYNVSALRAAVAEYDAAGAAYAALPARWPGLVTKDSLMNGTFWTHPSSGQPGMAQSVDKYRHV